MRALFAALLLVLPLVPGAHAAPCIASTHHERQVSPYWLVVDDRLCMEPASARHSKSVRVTEGPPADNRSATVVLVAYEHDRIGSSGGAFDVREHVEVRAGTALRGDAWYNSTRDAGGTTRCTLHLNQTHPRGTLAVRNALPLCAPQELLFP